MNLIHIKDNYSFLINQFVYQFLSGFYSFLPVIDNRIHIWNVQASWSHVSGHQHFHMARPEIKVL